MGNEIDPLWLEFEATASPGERRRRHREGPYADTDTEELLAECSRLVQDMQYSAVLAWGDVAAVDAMATVVLSRTAGAGDDLDPNGRWARSRALTHLDRTEELRTALAELESDEAFIHRCAAGLAALGDLPIGFDPADEDDHVPSWATDDTIYRQWRDAAVGGYQPPDTPSAWAEMVSGIEAPEGVSPGRAMVVFDWTSLTVPQPGWASKLVAEALGRYGTIVDLRDPSAAVVVAPTAVGRFVLAATLGRCGVLPVDCDTTDPDAVRRIVGALLGRLADREWARRKSDELCEFADAYMRAGALHAPHHSTT
jgi:hypothetical protein